MGKPKTTRSFGFIVSTTVTIDTQFTFTRRTCPWEIRIITYLSELRVSQLRTLKMVPKGALITANAIIVTVTKSFITMFAILIPAMVASPGLVWVFSAQFYFIIRKV